MPELEREGTKVRSLYNNATPTVTGSYPAFAEIRSISVEEGRFYDWGDEAAGRRVAFLGSNIKKQLFSSRSAVGETIILNDIPYTVIGVMAAKDQNSSYDGWDVDKIFVPFSAMLHDFPAKPPLLPTDVDHLLVAPKSLPEHETCKWQVKRALGRLHRFDPLDKEAAPVWDTVENAKAFEKLMDAMKYFLGAMGITTLLLGGIGVMNVMLVAVRERTREIGVRKAVGASSRAILQQFFVETIIIVFLSGGCRNGHCLRALRPCQLDPHATCSSRACFRPGNPGRCRSRCWARWRCFPLSTPPPARRAWTRSRRCGSRQEGDAGRR